jgi:hypothetical protein
MQTEIGRDYGSVAIRKRGKDLSDPNSVPLSVLYAAVSAKQIELNADYERSGSNSPRKMSIFSQSDSECFF